MITIIPNAFSVFRALSGVFILLFGHQYTPILLINLVIFAGLTDLLDGYLARVLACETALGALLDPICDTIFILSLLGYAVLRLQLPGICAAIILARYVAIGIYHAELLYLGYRNLSALWSGKCSSALTMICCSGYFLLQAGINSVVYQTILQIVTLLTIVMLLLSWMDYYRRYLRLWHRRQGET